jgi:hypothetical protein
MVSDRLDSDSRTICKMLYSSLAECTVDLVLPVLDNCFLHPDRCQDDQPFLLVFVFTSSIDSSGGRPHRALR